MLGKPNRPCPVALVRVKKQKAVYFVREDELQQIYSTVLWAGASLSVSHLTS